MVSEEIQRLRATMDGLVREQTDRQALRERQGEEIKARAQEYMTKQVQAAERYVQLRRELGKQEAGDPEDAELDAFAEPEDFAEQEDFAEHEPPPAAPPPPPVQPPAAVQPTRTPRRRAAREVEDDDDDFLNNRWREE
ncbi:hypothetical protein [Amycolatopsis sp.]|uniref:hypothetical protein n=1 Tax=Amycolatopsis sp. TaxID=37632 RepID=UPI002BD2B7B1|nr:hypothetical protein [Amycolatopsis sp.]HVV11386.1 hypothetical protein [Amycolatopsis sp.]